MDVFITFTVITSMSPAIDFLDSIMFSSHFITYVISVLDYRDYVLCAIAFLILVH